MNEDKIKMEQRLQNMKDFYIRAGALIDKLPDTLPANLKPMLKDTLLGDKELKQLIEEISTYRAPRIFLIGRTGVGKSSFVNAILGSYAAAVSDTKSCTAQVQRYAYPQKGRALLEILDTRGSAESQSLCEETSAEKMLRDELLEFSPDAAIFMLGCMHRDDVDKDALWVKNLAQDYEEVNHVRLPILTVINKCDEMAPARIKDPDAYPQSKIEKIQEVVQYDREILQNQKLKVDQILAVSSLLEWQTEDGKEIDAEQIPYLPQYDREHLRIAFDGRYHIEEVLDQLECSMADLKARAGLRMAARLTAVIEKLARQLKKTFSGVAAAVALTPIPVADLWVLIGLQSVLVCLIASLSGRDISLETAREFVLSLGGMVGAGYVFRMVAQQASKLLPGGGSFISSGVAALGTSAVGDAAIAYYIQGQDLKKAKKIFEAFKKARKSKK